MTYQLVENSKQIKRIADGAFIPADPDNKQYAEYLVWVVQGNVAQPADSPSLVQLQASALLKIDADVDAIYGTVMGNRQSEYAMAEADATSYKAAAYPAAPVPGSVQSWATAKNQTTTWAADNILATATSWRTAQANLRANRLGKKELVKACSTATALAAVMVSWAGFVATMRGALGL